MTRKAITLTAIGIAIPLGYLSYLFLPKLVGNLSILNSFEGNWIYPFLVVALVLSISLLFSGENAYDKYSKEEAIRERRYRSSILSFKDAAKSYLPKLFEDAKYVNIAFVNKNQYLSSRTGKHNLYLEYGFSIDKFKHYLFDRDANEFLASLKYSCNNNLPTFIFVNIGKDSVEFKIQDSIRALKKELPEAKIIACCSYAYYHDKYEAVKSLVEDGAVEKQIIHDWIFEPFHSPADFFEIVRPSFKPW